MFSKMSFVTKNTFDKIDYQFVCVYRIGIHNNCVRYLKLLHHQTIMRDWNDKFMKREFHNNISDIVDKNKIPHICVRRLSNGSNVCSTTMTFLKKKTLALSSYKLLKYYIWKEKQILYLRQVNKWKAIWRRIDNLIKLIWIIYESILKCS